MSTAGPRTAGTRADHAGAHAVRLDALRGSAALMVLGFHATNLAVGAAAGGLWGAVQRNLDAGVELFFVLSGYLIAAPFLRAVIGVQSLPDARAYAVRRAARILPAYWIVFGVAMLWATGHAGAQPGGLRLGSHLVLLHGLVPGETYRPLDLAWTLSVEAVFYLLVPLAAVAALASGGRPSARGVATTVAVAWTASACVALTAALLIPAGDVRLLLVRGAPGSLGQFGPGLLVALAEIAAERRGRPLASVRGLRPVVWTGAGALLAGGLAAASLPGDAGFVVRNELLGAGFGCALLALRARATTAGRVARTLAPVGTVSYGLYLWHWVTYRLLRAGGFSVGFAGLGAVNWLLAWAGLFAATIPVATLSWRYVEAPAQQWAARMTAAWRERPALRLPPARLPLPAAAAVEET